MRMKGLAVWAPEAYSLALHQRAKKLGVSPRELHLRLLAEGLGLEQHKPRRRGRPNKDTRRK